MQGPQDLARPTTAEASCVVLLMTLVYALSIADRYVGSTLMEPIKREFHLSDSAIGFLSGAGLAIFYCTAAVPLGALADRANRRNMIALSLAAWSAITVLCGVTRSFWQLLLARIGVGIGEAGATPAQQSLLADMVAPRGRAVAMTFFRWEPALAARYLREDLMRSGSGCGGAVLAKKGLDIG